MMIIFNIIVISLNRLTSTLGLKEVNYVLLKQMFLQERHRLASLHLILIVITSPQGVLKVNAVALIDRY